MKGPIRAYLIECWIYEGIDVHHSLVFLLRLHTYRRVVVIVKYLVEDEHPFLHQCLCVLTPHLQQQVIQLTDRKTVTLQIVGQLNLKIRDFLPGKSSNIAKPNYNE